MNKKILVAIAVCLVASAAGFVGLKAIFGDKATEIPGEEHTEKTLNIQEKTPTLATASNQSISTESKEAGP